MKRIFVSIFANFNANLATKKQKKGEKALKCVKKYIGLLNAFTNMNPKPLPLASVINRNGFGLSQWGNPIMGALVTNTFRASN